MTDPYDMGHILYIGFIEDFLYRGHKINQRIVPIVIFEHSRICIHPNSFHHLEWVDQLMVWTMRIPWPMPEEAFNM